MLGKIAENGGAEDYLKNVLLLSGAAGSGKSTAYEKLQHWVLTEYTRKRKENDDVTVVLLPVSLPQLKDPINGIFTEGCSLAYDGALRPSHADELRELVQDQTSKTELVFFLDAYDELPTTAMWKNLWRTNNLEQFRGRTSGDAKGRLCHAAHYGRW